MRAISAYIHSLFLCLGAGFAGRGWLPLGEGGGGAGEALGAWQGRMFAGCSLKESGSGELG